MALTSKGSLSPSTLTLWAKSDRGKESGRWHPLICHLLDVSASCLEIIDLEPARYRELLAEDFQTTPERAVALTAALVGLHDLGKANYGFQTKNDNCRTRVLDAGFTFLPYPEIPHGVVSHALLLDCLQRHFELDYDASNLLADAVGAHHGFRASEEKLTSALNLAKESDKPWKGAVDELFETVWTSCDAPLEWALESVSASCFQRLMGLTSVADWIGSSLDFWDYPGDAKAYLQGARQRASARLAQLGWHRRSPLCSRASFSELFSYMAKPGEAFSPRGLQKAVVELLGSVSEPVLLLVEAPMGEGKTEASFYAHARIQSVVGHRGAYLGLPSQATGNAMFLRLRDFLKEQGRDEPPDLQLLHGAQLLNSDYQELLFRSNSSEPDDEKEAVVARSYFSHLKRALLSEYGAGTIDQALLGILPVKHQFVRLWGLGNRTVILDEVHAYDTYTGELLLALIRWLKALGSSVILMSATLPTQSRQAMLEAFAGKPVREATQRYPRVSLVHEGALKELTFETRDLVSFKVRPAPVEVRALAAHALERLGTQGCMACICNTVDRAQSLYEAFRSLDPTAELLLFHARYPIQQKKDIEDRVLALFGKGGSDKPNPQRPTRAILVATQVVEQSLDLDFDVMISDLAPMDLMLQRAGRLQRHDKNSNLRGEHKTAVLGVCGLDSTQITTDCQTTFWEKIYAPTILLRTWIELKKMLRIDLNRHLDPLVQAVYSRELRLEGEERFAEYLEQHQRKVDNQDEEDRLDATRSQLGDPIGFDWESAPTPLFERKEDDPQSLLGTRKAQESATILPLYRHQSTAYLDPSLTKPIKLTAHLEVTDAVEAFGRTVKISRLGVVRGLPRQTKRPWSKTPLLQNVFALEFEAGVARIGSTELEMNPILGLVYRNAKENE